MKTKEGQREKREVREGGREMERDKEDKEDKLGGTRYTQRGSRI